MKNKILTMHNLLAVLGLLAILLFLCPAFHIYRQDISSGSQRIYYNLFTVVFGGSFGNEINQYLAKPAGFLVCIPLVFAFIFIVLGMICNVASNKCKWANYFGFLFYTASGTLFLCGEMIVRYVNVNSAGGLGTAGKLYWEGGTIAVGSLLCCIAFITLITAIMSTSKPKVQETY